MDFEEWWDSLETFTDEYKIPCEVGWEAGVQEGIDRMYRLHDICPECSMSGGQHKMDCGRGR